MVLLTSAAVNHSCSMVDKHVSSDAIDSPSRRLGIIFGQAPPAHMTSQSGNTIRPGVRRNRFDGSPKYEQVFEHRRWSVSRRQMISVWRCGALSMKTFQLMHNYQIDIENESLR